MKIIFLDIDGVLNNDRFLKRLHRQHVDLSSDKVLYGSMMLDKYAVKRLLAITDTTDAKIVISSSWREVFSLDEIREMLALKLKDLNVTKSSLEIIDRTPFAFEFKLTTRRNQIVGWLSDNQNEDIEKFIILEDCETMYELEDRTIRTSFATGLQILM